MMSGSSIVATRLHNQGLDAPRFEAAGDVVAWFGAVQAQEYALAKWALGLRLPGATDAAVEQALVEGTILRTHVMRPTWHFVASADIRWLLELTAPRVKRAMAHLDRQLELDDALFARSNAVIARALEGGVQRTRQELGTLLQQAGIPITSMRLGFLVLRAELDAIVCSGAHRGKQLTYALLDERAPHARSLPRETALVELTKRFFASHGPATVADFAWWSGLTKADARRGLELAQPEVLAETIDGQTYWHVAATPAVQHPAPEALLLPPYDEYTIAYREHGALLEPAYAEQPTSVIFAGVVVVGGTIVGNWRRTIGKHEVTVGMQPFRPWSGPEQDAIAAAARRFGAFLGLPVVLDPAPATIRE